ncbi:1-deoxy-D-xylulose-5-phosphate reductoisomerase [Pontibaca methylaminivorans]|uniref:1-deoxy-D-xylulose 5-phosphate reductoisomerase n=1 Tax=Pontibaca methylaminivorans TaxID=515897 RepID=A0A1R3WF75_9RHOB|nr:1-deoxy-D-xylulose-5-phosphate reductoisomerase [Pontibaca methylaminivorans]SIT76740.1 1-deoxy-D-xylulose 5-phosphate reductoisomerase [Pontibaca methylaminivorans]
MTRRITILGATGSVGQSTIDLIARARDSYQVVALTGRRNVERLARDAVALSAEIAVTAHEECLEELRARLAGSGIEAAAGEAALIEAAARPSDWVMSAIIGAAGLRPGLAALEQGAVLALANKETLVCAGALVRRVAARAGARILPVDSEHSAVFQALAGADMDAVDRIILTASGGAFRDWPAERLEHATLAEASCHPNWNMGQRITIDSASMFNKAMEVIEAQHLFDIAPERIEVLIHPESLVHALVGFRDGALMAHVGVPDMRHAIGYALHWPERRALPVERLDLARIGQMSFAAPDEGRWPALRLAREVMAAGGLRGAAFNAAKERALDGFIAGRIGFCDMARVVETVLARMEGDAALIDGEMTLDNVMATDHLARRRADEAMTQRTG